MYSDPAISSSESTRLMRYAACIDSFALSLCCFIINNCLRFRICNRSISWNLVALFGMFRKRVLPHPAHPLSRPFVVCSSRHIELSVRTNMASLLHPRPLQSSLIFPCISTGTVRCIPVYGVYIGHIPRNRRDMPGWIGLE